MTVAVVDDHVLAAVLRGAGPQLDATVHTTGLWYVRLCQAIRRGQGGSLSAPFLDLPPPRREQALAAVLELPPRIGLLSLRVLAPTMAWLSERHQLNLLGREALAAALVLDGTLVLSEANVGTVLVAAAEREDIEVRIEPEG